MRAGGVEEVKVAVHSFALKGSSAAVADGANIVVELDLPGMTQSSKRLKTPKALPPI